MNCPYCHKTNMNQTELDAHVAAIHPGGSNVVDHSEIPLEQLKTKRIQDIYDKTEQIMEAGFTHDSFLFDLKANKRVDYMFMETKSSLIPPQAYPIEVLGKNQGEYYSFIDENSINSFVNAAFIYVFTIRKNTITLLKAIDNASTVAELDAVEDNR